MLQDGGTCLSPTWSERFRESSNKAKNRDFRNRRNFVNEAQDDWSLWSPGPKQYDSIDTFDFASDDQIVRYCSYLMTLSVTLS